MTYQKLCILHSSVKLFADDCILYKAIHLPADTVKLQEDLCALQDWQLTYVNREQGWAKDCILGDT